MSVSVCFPAYNEESTIRDVLQEAHELLSASELDYEILVCNDGSADNTYQGDSVSARFVWNAVQTPWGVRIGTQAP